MIVLPNMGLVKWDQISDSFSHQQLASNFDVIDAHDHTPGKGKRIPLGGLAPLSVSLSNLQDNVFTAEKIANGAITSDKIADGAVTNGKLATAPNHATWRTVCRWDIVLRDGVADSTTRLFVGNEGVVSAADAPTSLATTFAYDAGEYDLPGLTTMFRLRASAMSNGIAAPLDADLPISLTQYTSGGTSGQHTVSTFGPITSGKVVVPSTMGASQELSSLTGSEFDIDDDGVYGLQAVVPALAAGAIVKVSVALQMHHV